MTAHIKLGFVPTRRSVFSAPDALKYRDLTAKRLTELGVDFVDITDINDEGLPSGSGRSSNGPHNRTCKLSSFANLAQTYSVPKLQ